MDKKCSGCQIVKPLVEFCRNRSTKDGLSHYCKSCHKELRRKHNGRIKAYGKAYSRAYRERRPETVHMFGLIKYWPWCSGKEALNKYCSLLSLQDGRCAICREPETERDPRKGTLKKLAVDHCHTTGAVRGLLCSACNKILSFALDHNIGILDNMKDYIKPHLVDSEAA